MINNENAINVNESVRNSTPNYSQIKTIPHDDLETVLGSYKNLSKRKHQDNHQFSTFENLSKSKKVIESIDLENPKIIRENIKTESKEQKFAGLTQNEIIESKIDKTKSKQGNNFVSNEKKTIDHKKNTKEINQGNRQKNDDKQNSKNEALISCFDENDKDQITFPVLNIRSKRILIDFDKIKNHLSQNKDEFNFSQNQEFLKPIKLESKSQAKKNQKLLNEENHSKNKTFKHESNLKQNEKIGSELKKNQIKPKRNQSDAKSEKSAKNQKKNEPQKIDSKSPKIALKTDILNDTKNSLIKRFPKKSKSKAVTQFSLKEDKNMENESYIIEDHIIENNNKASKVKSKITENLKSPKYEFHFSKTKETQEVTEVFVKETKTNIYNKCFN